MRATIVAIIAAVALMSLGESRAQNDWQYPDPYFGVLEIEKSRDSASRVAVAPQPRSRGWQRQPAAGRSSGSWSRSRRVPAANVTRGRSGPTAER
jgi:hypothetical protein